LKKLAKESVERAELMKKIAVRQAYADTEQMKILVQERKEKAEANLKLPDKLILCMLTRI